MLQLPFDPFTGLIAEQLRIDRPYRVPIRSWTTQFGRRWPLALTPARAVIVVARKPTPNGDD